MVQTGTVLASQECCVEDREIRFEYIKSSFHFSVNLWCYEESDWNHFWSLFRVSVFCSFCVCSYLHVYSRRVYCLGCNLCTCDPVEIKEGGNKIAWLRAYGQHPPPIPHLDAWKVSALPWLRWGMSKWVCVDVRPPRAVEWNVSPSQPTCSCRFASFLMMEMLPFLFTP